MRKVDWQSPLPPLKKVTGTFKVDKGNSSFHIQKARYETQPLTNLKGTIENFITHPVADLSLENKLDMAQFHRTLKKAFKGHPIHNAISIYSDIEGSANIMRGFLILNTREAELAMFAEMAGDAPYASNEDVPYAVLLPAFITSELKTAFQIGFLLFLPFLVIDLVIASILMSLGMMMLSPMLVALPSSSNFSLSSLALRTFSLSSSMLLSSTIIFRWNFSTCSNC